MSLALTDCLALRKVARWRKAITYILAASGSCSWSPRGTRRFGPTMT